MKKIIISLALVLGISSLQMFASIASTVDFNVLSSDNNLVAVPRAIVNAVPYLQRLKANSGFKAESMPFSAIQLDAIFDTIQQVVNNATKPTKGFIGKLKDKFKHSAFTSEDTLVAALADTLRSSAIGELELQAQVVENFRVPILTRAFAQRIAALDMDAETRGEFKQIINALAAKRYLTQAIDDAYLRLYGISLSDARVRGGTPVLFDGGATSSTAGKSVDDLLEEEANNKLDGIYNNPSYALTEIELDPMSATVFGSQGVKLYALDLSGKGLTSIEGLKNIPNIQFVRTINLSNNPDLSLTEYQLRDLRALDQLQMINIQGTNIKPGMNAILITNEHTMYM